VNNGIVILESLKDEILLTAVKMYKHLIGNPSVACGILLRSDSLDMFPDIQDYYKQIVMIGAPHRLQFDSSELKK
jgi:hypothetical protein